jgi:hypothetical protein
MREPIKRFHPKYYWLANYWDDLIARADHPDHLIKWFNTETKQWESGPNDEGNYWVLDDLQKQFRLIELEPTKRLIKTGRK